MELKKVEEGVIPIYENETKERLINARELFYALRGKETKTKFADWIKERVIKYKFMENLDYIPFRKFTKGDQKGFGNKATKEYYLTIDTSKEICMIENNETGRNIRRYFIEVEKRYRNIINTSNNTNQLINIMQNAIDYMRENNIRVDNLELLNYKNNIVIIGSRKSCKTTIKLNKGILKGAKKPRSLFVFILIVFHLKMKKQKFNRKE